MEHVCGGLVFSRALEKTRLWRTSFFQGPWGDKCACPQSSAPKVTAKGGPRGAQGFSFGATPIPKFLRQGERARSACTCCRHCGSNSSSSATAASEAVRHCGKRGKLSLPPAIGPRNVPLLRAPAHVVGEGRKREVASFYGFCLGTSTRRCPSAFLELSSQFACFSLCPYPCLSQAPQLRVGSLCPGPFL